MLCATLSSSGSQPPISAAALTSCALVGDNRSPELAELVNRLSSSVPVLETVRYDRSCLPLPDNSLDICKSDNVNEHRVELRARLAAAIAVDNKA